MSKILLWFNYITITILFFSLPLLFSGCKTTGQSNNSIPADTYSVGRLEGTICSLDTILDDSTNRINSITEASRDITDGIDRLEYLFTEYERETSRLREEIDNLKRELETAKEDSNNIGCYSSNNDFN